MRRIIAAALSVLYLILLCGPIASIAMHSKTILHAITGECSGDCSICSYSPESRALNTCCCSKKRNQEAHRHEDEAAIPECFKKKPVDKKAIIASCGYPCGSGKIIALASDPTNEILPYYFTEQIVLSYSESLYSELSHLMISRDVEPPDHPPNQA